MEHHDLVERARAGDAQAFEEIVGQYADPVYRIVAGHLGAADAEDASQEVFLRVHRGLARFRRDAKLATWIHRIATNVALQCLRTKRRRPLLERFGLAEPPSPLPGPDVAVGADERRVALRRALDTLPEGQRAVVVLRMQGLPFEEVARTLGIRRPTAESRMARAKERLRKVLSNWIET